MANGEQDEMLGHLEFFILLMLMAAALVVAIGAAFVKFADANPMGVFVWSGVALVVTVVLEVWLDIPTALLNRLKNRG